MAGPSTTTTPTCPRSRLGLESVPLENAAEEADAVVLVTAHPGIDYAVLAERSALFIVSVDHNRDKSQQSTSINPRVRGLVN